MRIEVVPDEPALAVRAADIISDLVRTTPGTRLGLPTGDTPLSTYEELRRRSAAGSIDLGGVTVDVADLLEARAVLALALGAPKAAAVGAAIEGPMTADVPASWLQSHADVTWLLDQTAAAGLRR